MKCRIGEFYEKLLTHIIFNFGWTLLMTTLYAELSMFLCSGMFTYLFCAYTSRAHLETPTRSRKLCHTSYYLKSSQKSSFHPPNV
jgi:hypothetical protein